MPRVFAPYSCIGFHAKKCRACPSAMHPPHHHKLTCSSPLSSLLFVSFAPAATAPRPPPPVSFSTSWPFLPPSSPVASWRGARRGGSERKFDSLTHDAELDDLAAEADADPCGGPLRSLSSFLVVVSLVDAPVSRSSPREQCSVLRAPCTPHASTPYRLVGGS